MSYSVRGGELVEAPKMRALPEGGDDRVALVEFLRLYRDVLQLLVDRLWSLSEIPYVAVYFRKTVKPRRTRTVMTIDVNFDNVTLAVFALSGELLKLKRFKTPLRRMLTHRIWIERIQRKYSRSWRFIRGVRRAIRRHGERIRSIAWDYAHKLGDRVAEIANEHSSTIVLEDLDKLRDRVNRSSNFNKKLSLWFYKKMQFTISYEALERRLLVSYVNPMKTSSTCPKCGSRLEDSGGRVLGCGRCGLTGDRDVIACINLFYRYSRCGVLGVAPNAPKPDENPSGMQGKRDEAMKSTNINLYQS
ncbi:MAG: zinc ribbon domain-containing protein [Sulfolobales archaeon]